LHSIPHNLESCVINFSISGFKLSYHQVQCQNNLSYFVLIMVDNKDGPRGGDWCDWPPKT